MREIKFRAWEKHLKTMIEVDNLDFESKLVNKDGTWRMFYEVELMQYTGLKDFNGKEIYEGDILFLDYENSEYATVDNKYHEVVWGGEDYPAFDLKNWQDFISNGLSYLQATRAIPFYVAGNIYENPELLENVK